MSSLVNIPSHANAVSLDGSAQVTSTSNGSGVDIRDYVGLAMVILDAGAATAGTSPTLDVKLQESSDDSTYSDISGATFTQVTDSAASHQTLRLDLKPLKRYIRVVATVGGTSTPTFAYGVTMVAAKQVD